ncbi:unnamed protein product [Periconia digitata]|uniref:Xylanolytic transcriptional activator regulatory domain-containing protein n=1 Tax=Periconia digitata TaxID=1303443 RepID=A0A9W4XJE6_9PLEO|nr:unnamed protein product [Periconia digitata]
MDSESVTANDSPPAAALDTPARKKQKRNKPTLSCEECVERKTKSQCKYSDAANLIAASGRSITPLRSRKPSTKPATVPVSSLPNAQENHTSSSPQVHVLPVNPPRHNYRSASLSSTSSSPFLLSNIPYSNHTSPFFGLGSEHPFANYWTNRGGLAEVVGALPAKDHADILVAKYFDAVDPVYPMVHRRNFYADYERFWSLPVEEKQTADPVLVALHFVVYAMATQFIHMSSDHQNQAQLAEFYVSASQQSLRLSSYLSKASVRTLQAMVLIGYFLMNDNHASDAWAFGGVLVRQSYAMGLHRDPDIISPRCSRSDKQQRRKLWQAIFFQDTFLTVLLKLPPTATFSDVRVESLTDDLDEYANGATMSISNIAPMSDTFPPYELADRQYIRSMWHMAHLVQRTVCTPRSLGHPLTDSPDAKTKLIDSYDRLLRSFPPELTTSDSTAIRDLADSNPRRLRQNLFLRSNYWHCVMAIQADENEAGDVVCDVKGALEAAQMALLSFFHFWEYLRVDAGVWWVFQHRAFEEALLIARILGVQDQAHVDPATDPFLAVAKEDARKTLDILEMVSAPEARKTRTDVLKTAFNDIKW